MMRLDRFLSKTDCIYILDLINSSISCDNEDSFHALFNRLNMLIEFDYAICGLGKLSSQDNMVSFQLLNISYPSDWLELYMIKQYHLIDPIVSEHIKHFALQCWADTYRKHGQAREFIANAHDFNLNDGYTSGIRERHRNLGSIFTLSGQHDQKSPRTESILNILTPHFHQTLLRITNGTNKKIQQLTLRESEVLNWLKHGKTSWDVSRILNISERTVNFHCASIVQKLDAVSRSHAVAIAIDNGLVALD